MQITKEQAIKKHYHGMTPEIFDEIVKLGLIRASSDGMFAEHFLPAANSRAFQVVYSKVKRELAAAANATKQTEEERFNAEVAKCAAKLNSMEGRRLRRNALQALANSLADDDDEKGAA